MSTGSTLFLFFAGALGGALNAVAGGGSFVAFPALLFIGVPPVPANATCCVSLFVGVTATGGVYKSRLDVARRIMIPFVATSVVGGLCGAFLLIRTPGDIFLKLLPWLMLGATLLFAFGRQLSRPFGGGIARDPGPRAVFWASFFEFFVAIYGGYFGGGIGIMNLAMLSIIGMTDMHVMNALRVVLGGIINGVASATFVATGAVYWREAISMTAGAVLGGYSAARYAQRLSQSRIRALVIGVGATMTIYFFAHGR